MHNKLEKLQEDDKITVMVLNTLHPLEYCILQTIGQSKAYASLGDQTLYQSTTLGRNVHPTLTVGRRLNYRKLS